MRTEPATIDLGVYSRQEPAHVPEPGRPWPPRALLARRPRPWLLASLVVTLLGPLVAAAAPAPPALTLVWTVPEVLRVDVAHRAVGETDLFTLSGADDRVTLTAYRLSDGALRWQAPVDLQVASGTTALDELAVMVTGGVPVVFPLQLNGPSTAYDPDTGQLRWTGEGSGDTPRDGLVPLYQRSFRPGGGSRVDLTVRDADRGTVVAELADVVGEVHFREAPDGTVQLLALHPGGELVRYDLATGTVLASTATAYTDGSVAPAQLAHDLVLLSGGKGVVAYDAATLDLRWRIPYGFRVTSCGPFICVDTNGEVAALDPATGAPRWSIGCEELGQVAGCQLVVSELASGGDRLLIQELPYDRSPWSLAGWSWIAAAETGRRLTEGIEWTVQGSAGAEPGADLLLAREVRPADGDGPPALPSGPVHLWWARSGSELDRIEVLGMVEADACQLRDPYLVCNTQGEPIEVWRIG